MRCGKKFVRTSLVGGYLTVMSDELSRKHNFSHKKIKLSIDVLLQGCKQSKLWNDKSDISHQIEVYYIRDRIYSMKEFDAYFEIQIKSGHVDCSNILNEMIILYKVLLL